MTQNLLNFCRYAHRPRSNESIHVNSTFSLLILYHAKQFSHGVLSASLRDRFKSGEPGNGALVSTLSTGVENAKCDAANFWNLPCCWPQASLGTTRPWKGPPKNDCCGRKLRSSAFVLTHRTWGKVLSADSPLKRPTNTAMTCIPGPEKPLKHFWDAGRTLMMGGMCCANALDRHL